MNATTCSITLSTTSDETREVIGINAAGWEKHHAVVAPSRQIDVGYTNRALTVVSKMEMDRVYGYLMK